ncbi:hypothetical protein L596_017879 [Steinernema carpocapsae]|uniref:Uncharacterized protein n=1 Tax=Steinernema carpocapsae TaxID=34508 RepID=A0A4U5N3P2_STECR|nr:hypothetical protein L596_017879 [Steinernema carpocapsae]
MIFNDGSEAIRDNKEIFKINFDQVPQYEGKRISTTVRAAQDSHLAAKIYGCTVTDCTKSCELKSRIEFSAGLFDSLTIVGGLITRYAWKIEIDCATKLDIMKFDETEEPFNEYELEDLQIF